jgi:hypothetical protein
MQLSSARQNGLTLAITQAPKNFAASEDDVADVSRHSQKKAQEKAAL